MKIEEVCEDLKKEISESIIYTNEPMSKHTSFKIGGTADIFIKIKTIEDLKNILKYANENNISITITGNGSNLLVKDKGIRGITLQIGLDNIEIKEDRQAEEDVKVYVEAGVKLAYLSVILQKNGIEGFEFASGIPGTIGGAVKMNAGAYGKEVKDVIEEITYMNSNLEIIKIKNEEALFSYRHSRFSNSNDVVLGVTLKLKVGNSEEIQEKIQEYRKQRTEKQPIELPSAGSTFKRGSDFITAQLIDMAGLKGYKIGGAEVSTKHAGFVVNTGNATAEDVLKLTDYIKQKIYEEYGKEIDLEIQVVGE